MPDYKLSDAELHIMRFFWQHGAMRTDELATLVAERGWKPTTLLTFLSRLAAKGMLAVSRQGKANLYTPCIGQDEYAQRESRVFLDEMYGGSARNFLAAMVEGNSLSAKEVQELKTWLSGLEVNDDD